MAEEKAKPKRKHLHQVRVEEAHDGSHIEHRTYKSHRGATETEPEHKNVATHATPEEAAQSMTEGFNQNAPPEEAPDPGAAPPDAGGGAAPAAAGPMGQ